MTPAIHRTPTTPTAPRTLVTGGSRGIGLALARVFARHGHDLVLTARSHGDLADRAAEIEEEHGVAVHVIVADLTDPEAPSHIHRELSDGGVPVNVLVNNAGFGSQGPFHEQDLSNELDMVRVNVDALTHLTGLFLPDMIRRRSGGVLQVASTAGFQPGPYMSVYYASKAYVLFFAEAVGEEVREKGVTVTALCPGPTRTSFQERARMEEAPLARGAVPMLTPEQVAEAGYRGLMRGQRVVTPGAMNKLGTLSVRLGPRSLVRRLVGKLNAKR